MPPRHPLAAVEGGLWSPTIDRRGLLRGLAAGGGAAALVGSDAAWAQTGRPGGVAGLVETLAGSAIATTGGKERALAAQSEVFVADLVRTGTEARATLKLGQRTVVRLGSATEIKVDRYLMDAGGEIDLVSGALQFERTGPRSATDLRFRSPYGLIAVRGTRFYAGTFLGVWGVFVAHGKVDVTGGGKTVSVGRGLGTNVERPGAAPTAPRAWGDARVRAAIAATR